MIRHEKIIIRIVISDLLSLFFLHNLAARALIGECLWDNKLYLSLVYLMNSSLVVYKNYLN